MHSIRKFLFPAAALSVALLARSDELADKGRDILNRNQHAVVTVQVVSKMKLSFMGAGNSANEFKQELTGTVVDGASGLTVLALSACEPGDMLESLMADFSGDSDVGDASSKVKMDTELSDLKLMLEDGTELAADIVLRDKDLDLAFIRPRTKPSTALTSLDLTKSSRAQVLDPIVTLNRLGQSAGRAYAASVERISAVVQKPRLFYIPESSATATTLGSPAFATDGKLIGVFVMRSVGQKGGGALNLLNGNPGGLTAIILPADDVLKAARQALEIKEPGAKKEETNPAKETKDDSGKK